MGNRAYYNEIDPYAAEWLRNLIKAKHIPDGDVDERSIVDVQPMDIADYTQCHFFAGIAGWSLAMRLAGWPDDRPVWTGSCPCQPFSVAGKGRGAADERHLWPDFFRLIRACRPAVVMGEQVAGAAGYNWFDGVRSDLEGEGYGARAVDIPACSANAPHIRQRLYWVAQNMGVRQQAMGVAYANSAQDDEEQQEPAAYEGGRGADGIGGCGLDRDVADADGELHDRRRDIRQRRRDEYSDGGSDMADADDQGREGRELLSERPGECSAWTSGVEWRRGADGKTRRVKSGVCLLVDGVPNRVGRLRAYGNAIVPPLAAEVIKAFMDA